MSSYDYDFLVIGGGSGGVSSAKRAAQIYGKKVGIIEGGRWGGTCVNVGCVPKKVMFQASSVYEHIKEYSKHYNMESFDQEGATFNWNKLKEKRDKYITRLNGLYLSGLQKQNVDVIEGWGSFVDAHTIKVNMADGSSKTITSENVLIAVGGKPMVTKDTPGVVEHTITSDGFFELTEQPKKVVVVGAGYIAVELAGVLHGLGSETHLVIRKQHALRSFDPDIAMFLDKVMVGNGMHMHRNTNGIAKVELMPDGSNKKRVTCVNNDEVIENVDCVLMAPGRVPNVDGLNLPAVNVQQNNKNHTIIVDEYQNTNIANIFALGDVTGRVELTPMAIAAGRRLVDRLYGPKDIYGQAKTSYENVPTVVFSHPPIGTIGITEPEAVTKYGQDNIKIYKSTFTNLFYSMFDMEPAQKPKTYMKIICAGIEEQVVGLHMIGLNVDEMLQGFGVAMKMGCTKADLDACIAIHPTGAEEVVTMGTWGTSPQYTGAKVSPLMGGNAPVPTLKNPKPADSKM